VPLLKFKFDSPVRAGFATLRWQRRRFAVPTKWSACIFAPSIFEGSTARTTRFFSCSLTLPSFFPERLHWLSIACFLVRAGRAVFAVPVDGCVLVVDARRSDAQCSSPFSTDCLTLPPRWPPFCLPICRLQMHRSTSFNSAPP